jgi:DNA-binding MarR family transcriptional regulator
MRSATRESFADFRPVCKPQLFDLRNQLEKSSNPERDRSEEVRWLRNVLRARASRAEFFSGSLFADPAWDMLLSLYCAELEQTRISVTRLWRASRVPETTALRWIGALQKNDLIVKTPDPLDGRRVFVTLSKKGSHAIREYFRSLPEGIYPSRD